MAKKPSGITYGRKEMQANCDDCLCNPCICNRPETATYHGGGKRDIEDIPAYHLYPRAALRRVLRRYEHGRIKYGDRNWEGGLPAEDCFNRAMEHLSKYVNGWNDEDHLAAAVFNINCIMTYEEEGQVPINFRRFRCTIHSIQDAL
jgi:hypothetical protein